MLFALVITELVKAIEFAFAGLDRTGVLWREMLFGMAAEVTGTAEGCGTAYVSAGNAIAIETGVNHSWRNSCDGNTLTGEGCAIGLGGDACRAGRLGSRTRGGYEIVKTPKIGDTIIKNVIKLLVVWRVTIILWERAVVDGHAGGAQSRS